jgi:hypothetical protein
MKWWMFLACVTFAEECSFHVLIATIGKESLFQMLESLRCQLEERDYLTIVYDAKDVDGTLGRLPEVLKEFRCHHEVVVEPVNLGFLGHGIRNKHNVLTGDFVLHADDDDVYLPDAFEAIRRTCRDVSTLYIFRALVPDISIREGILITGRPFQLGHITTGMGVVPSQWNSRSTWAYRYGGDFDFYNGLFQTMPKTKFVRHTIYQHRPNEGTVLPQASSK